MSQEIRTSSDPSLPENTANKTSKPSRWRHSIYLAPLAALALLVVRDKYGISPPENTPQPSTPTVNTPKNTSTNELPPFMDNFNSLRQRVTENPALPTNQPIPSSLNAEQPTQPAPTENPSS